MPGRKFTQANSNYRYGFNGQEKSTEINDNSYTAEFWQYDSRIGRRWNVDPVTKVGESPYMAFAGNPIWFSDPNGADTTLPGAGGKSVTLGTGADNVQSFDGGAKKLQNSATTVSPAAGTLKSFTYGGHNFDAHFDASSGAFTDYNTTTKDGKLQSYDNFYKDYNAEGSVGVGDVVSMMKSVFKYVSYWGSPVKSFDTYGSVQLKDKMSTGAIPLLGVEKSDVTWSLFGAQAGYNTKTGGYGEVGSFNNSYFNMGLSDNHAARITPAAFSLFSFGNKGSGGDFNVKGRTLITIAPFGKILANQLDYTYDIHGKIGVGGRLKAEIPMGRLSGEAAIGYRYNLGWPRALTNKWPSIFGDK